MHLGYFNDRIQISSLIIVASFVAVLALSSQSAASWPTYLLGLIVAVSWRSWDDVLAVPYFRFVCAVIGYLVLSTVWSPVFTLSSWASVAGRGALILLFVVACAECQFRGQLKHWLGRSLAIIATIAAGGAIYVHFQVPDYFPGTRLHGLGQLDNPVIAGMVYGAALVIMIDLIWYERCNRWRITGLLGAFTLVYAIFLTDSRGAWASILVGVYVYFLASIVPDRQRFLATLVATMVLLGTGFLAVIGDEAMRGLLTPRGTSYRLDIWQETISRVVSEGSLLFGLGVITPDQIQVGDIEFRHPHSLYLSVFFQGGLIGVGLVGALAIWTVRVLIEHYANRDAKLGLGLFSIALLGYLLDGHELIDKVSDMWFLFWLPVALALGLTWRSPAVTETEV